MRIQLFIIAVLFGQACFAHQIEWIRHTHSGTEQVVLKYSLNKSLLFTNTGYFEPKPQVRIGYFERQKSSPSFTRLNTYLSSNPSDKFSATRQNLVVSQHIPKIYLDGREAPYTSLAYKYLTELLQQEFADAEWSLTEGTKSQLQKNATVAIEYWKARKRQSTVTRTLASTCTQSAERWTCPLNNGVAYFKGQGHKR